jgi:hypothetical protein
MLQGLLNHVLDYSIKHLMVSWITFFQHVTTWAVIQSEWQVDNAALKCNLKCQAHYSIVLDWIPGLTYFTMYKLTVYGSVLPSNECCLFPVWHNCVIILYHFIWLALLCWRLTRHLPVYVNKGTLWLSVTSIY